MMDLLRDFHSATLITEEVEEAEIEAAEEAEADFVEAAMDPGWTKCKSI